MKVVLFCGGQGLRLRDHSERLPKPMVAVGYRPILWHVMRYYAHFGHREFILCLGYKADVIKNYFLEYREALSNDFVLSGMSGKVELLSRDISDWRVTFVTPASSRASASACWRSASTSATNPSSPTTATSSRTRRSTGGSSGSWRPTRSARSCASGRRATPSTSSGSARRVSWPGSRTSVPRTCGSTGVLHLAAGAVRPHAAGRELIEEPFSRLIGSGRLMRDAHDGYWAPMDTLKDMQESAKPFAHDLVLAPGTDDAHQDHRSVAEVVRQTFRSHLVAEYEIPKYDGDLGRPNVFVAIDDTILARKIDLLHEHYPSQHGRTWWGGDTVRAIARLRGIESATRFAEAFSCRRIVL